MDDLASEIRVATAHPQMERTVSYEFRRMQRRAEEDPEQHHARTGAVGRWFVTPHAVRRYIERVDHRVAYRVALGALIHEGTQARFVKVVEYTSATGQPVELWRGKKPRRLRFYVTQNPGELRPTLITVLKGPTLL